MAVEFETRNLSASEVDLFGSGESETIKVCARIRPLNSIEAERYGGSCLKVDADEKGISLESVKTYQFRFDHVFKHYIDQATVFNSVAKPMIEGFLNGYNGALLAYGQTGSGKTYTMQGESLDTEESRGIIPRFLEHMFESMKGLTDVEYDIRASFIEVYKEKMYDLLDSTIKLSEKPKLSIFEDKAHGLIITGATEVPIQSAAEAMRLYERGIRTRMTAETEMNERSSRSHAVFLLTAAKQELTSNRTRFSQMYLVDLAGSEKVWKTGVEGARLEEAKYINRSLLSLGQVIYKLATKSAHVPYRDSKLTRLLQNSLGGNAKTCLIINLSPSPYNAQETLSTLRFGDQSSRIQNTPTVNECLGVEELESILMRAQSSIQRNSKQLVSMEQDFAQLKEFLTVMGISEDDVWAIAEGRLTIDDPEDTLATPASIQLSQGKATDKGREHGGVSAAELFEAFSNVDRQFGDDDDDPWKEIEEEENEVKPLKRVGTWVGDESAKRSQGSAPEPSSASSSSTVTTAVEPEAEKPEFRLKPVDQRVKPANIKDAVVGSPGTERMFHRRSDSRGESKGNDFEGGSSDTDQEWELEDITEASVPPATEGEFDSNTVGAQEERIIEGAEIESGSEDEGNAARGKAGRKATKEADANLRRFLERQSHFQEQRAARLLETTRRINSKLTFAPRINAASAKKNYRPFLERMAEDAARRAKTRDETSSIAFLKKEITPRFYEAEELAKEEAGESKQPHQDPAFVPSLPAAMAARHPPVLMDLEGKPFSRQVSEIPGTSAILESARTSKPGRAPAAMLGAGMDDVQGNPDD